VTYVQSELWKYFKKNKTTEQAGAQFDLIGLILTALCSPKCPIFNNTFGHLIGMIAHKST